MAKEKVAMAVTSGKEERKGENFMRRELSHEFGRKMIAVLFAFAMTMFSVFGLGVSENEVLAATTSMVTANDKGYFVPSEAYTKEQIQTYKDNNTYPILSAATYTDSQDWLFAGWFTDADCETPIGSEIPDTGAYAKFVHADVLSVKCQIESSTQSDTEHTNMRLISTLDSLMYDKVGFKVRFNNGKEHDFEVNRVFKRINAKEEYGNECGYSPKAFHDSSEYFMTYSLLDIDNKNFGKAFYVEPYWVTLDGTEVSGVSRYARVEDGYLKIVNVPVRLMTEGNINTASVTVDYTCDTDGLYELYTIESYAGYDNGTVFGADATGVVFNDTENDVITYTVSQDSSAPANGMLVNLRFQVQQELMPSESKFEVSYTGLGDGTNTIALNDTTIVFRNFPLTYSGGYDISWYKGYEKSETYAIASAADLYGLAALANGDTDYGTVDFTNKTIYVVSDISVNKGSASLEKGWVAESGATTYPWKPIGKSTAFQGTFDGQGNTISGIYVKETSDYSGVFGKVGSSGAIQRVKIKNSWFQGAWFTGSIAGQLEGDIKGVYAGTDVILDCTNNVIGGLVGQCSGTVNISDSWFAGTLRTTFNQTGGIVGRLRGDVILQNCLNTGSVISTYDKATNGVGGLIGWIDSGSADIIKSMNTGEVKAVVTTTVGAIVGKKDSGLECTMTDVYATNDCRVNTEDKTLDADAVTGYISLARTDILDTAAYTAYLGQDIKLNLDETWVARYQDVPAIRSLVDDSELTYDTAWYKSAEATNIIKNEDELYGFMMLSTVANEQFTGETIQLGADIKVGEGYEWTPVGTSTSLKFEGSFDGKWHTISGITVNATKAGAGLFGNVGADSTIKRLTLTNSTLTSSSDNFGSIVGYTEGNVEDIHVTKTVNITQIEGGVCVGGIVGQYGGSSEASITRCWFAGTVTSSTSYGRCGGIVGRMYLGTKTLEDCLNTGTVTAEKRAGGLIGSIIGSSSSSVEAVIRNCMNTGVVTSNELKTTGCVFGDSTNYVTQITMENVYTTVAENGTTSLIGTDSINDTVSIQGMPAQISDVMGENGYIYTEFNFDSSVNENCWVATAERPELRKFSKVNAITDLEKYQRVNVGWYYNSYVNGALEDSMTYTISTSGDLYGFSQISASDNFKNDTIKLGNSIIVNEGTATETEWTGENPHQWTPIGRTKAFSGTFDGNGKNISGIYMKDSAAVNENGLFAWTSTSSTIKNLRLTNSYFELDNTSTERSYIGSIAGYGCGSLENVYSDAIIVTDISYAGGLVGGFAGDAEKSISKSWYAGYLLGKRYVGGIAGLAKVNTKTIENCLVTGTVSSEYVYNGGGYTYFGGIVGQVYDLEKMNIRNCLMNANLDVAIVEHSDPDATGSVVGRIQAATEIANVYTTGSMTVSGSSINEVGKITSETLNGMPMMVADVTDAKAYVYAELDFYDEDTNTDGIWAAVSDNGPVIKSLYTGDIIKDLDNYQRVSCGWYYNEFVDGALADSMTYTISTSGDLYGFSQISASDNFKNDTVQLGADIVLNEGTAKETGWVGENPHQWNPISRKQSFAGTFDGNNKSITGIYMKDSAAVNENGLFAWTSTSSKIKNLRLTNSYFELNNTSTERSYIGSIAGYGCGSLENVYSDAIIVTDISYAGGLVGSFAGDAEKSISKSWYAGKISGKRYVGGIAGQVKVNTKTIENCLVTGTVSSEYVYNGGGYTYFGGIVGQVYDLEKMNIRNCLMNANLDVAIVEHSDPDATGSVVGRIQAATEITNVYTTGDATVSNNPINEIGKIKSGTLTGMPIETTNVIGENAYIYTELDFYDEDKNDGGIWAVVQDKVPVIKSLYAGDVIKDLDSYQRVSIGWYYNEFIDGTLPDSMTYTISTSEDLYGLSQLSANDNFKNDTVRLGADIVLNEGTAKETGWVGENPHQWTPIGKSKAFAGTFNGMDSEGQIHTISGFYMKDNSTATDKNGLFAQTEYGSTVKNVKLINSYIELRGNTSLKNIGSIVGYSCGNLDTIYSDAIIVTDAQYVGGLVGYSNYYDSTFDSTQEIKNCWFDGAVIGDSFLYAGGIAGTVTYQKSGENVVSLTDCLNTGRISNNKETGNQFVGGIVGYVWGGFTINLIRCLNVGRIDLNCYDVAHSFVGRINSSSAIVTVDNCYTAEESCVDNNGKIKVWSSAATIKNKAGNTVSDADVLVSESVILGEAALQNAPGLFGEDTKWMTGTVMAQEDGAVIGTPILAVFGEWWNSLQTPSALVVMDMDIADGKTGESSANAYEIENLAELYGFAVLSQTDNFAGKYIKLSDNIDVNPDEKATDWKAGTADATLPWKYSIGKPSDGSRFAGTFDGNGKTISGVHMVQETTYLGLFAATEQESAVKNLRLTNSYFKQLIPYGSNGFVGSVICDCRGTVSGVYSNAIIETGNVQAGGIVARANGYDYTQKASDSKGYATVNIDNCWFDGSIYQEGDSENAGGIAAVAVQGITNMENCLFTGTIEGTYGMGGLCGFVMANENNTLNIASSVSAGKITNPLESGRVGAIVARVANSLSYDAESNTFDGKCASLNLENVFASRECYSEAFGYADEMRNEVDEEGNIRIDVNGNEVKVEAATIDGTVIRTHGKDRFVGYCTEVSGEQLNFSDIWAVRNSGVPVPKCFVDVVGQDNITDISGLDTQLGLDTLTNGTETVTFANAVNQGMGNYVITLTDKVKSDYTAYLDVLDADDGLNFTKHVDNTGGTAEDGVFNTIYTKADGDWVINVTFVENKSTMYISVNTAGVESLSPYLQSDYTDTSGTDTITLSMLKNTSQAIVDDVVVYEYGNTFVIQLPNGHFIINDSGDSGGDERKDFVNLITYLKTLAGTSTNEETGETTQNPIYVDAWTISHQHSDHMYAVRGFSHLDKFPEIADVEIYVDGFYINEPNNAVLHIENEYFHETVEKQYDSINLLRKNATSSDTPSIYRYQTGQRYYFNGVKMDVILAQEQIPYSDYPTHNEKYNTCSVTLLFTLDSGEKIYIGGDSLEVNDAYIMAAYGDNPSVLSNINVYVAPHHGKNTAINYIQYLTNDDQNKFDVVLYPCSVVYDEEVYNKTHTFESAVYANIYLNKWSLKSTGGYYTYGDGNVVLSFQNGSIDVKTIAVE